MSSTPASRTSDMHTCGRFHSYPLVIVGHQGGPITPPGEPSVQIEGLPAATIGTMAQCRGSLDCIVTGATQVLIHGLPAARVDERTAHQGTIIAGASQVFIGGDSAGPGGLPVSWDGDDIRIGNAIVITGSDEFLARTMARLAVVGSRNAGRDLLERIDGNPGHHNVTIREGTRKTTEDAVTDTDALAPWHGGTGRGSDSKITYDPDYTVENPGNPPMPADGVLFHELAHAEGTVNGTSWGHEGGGDNWLMKDDRRVVYPGGNNPSLNPAEQDYPEGFPRPPTEYQYLKESGYGWHRETYGARRDDGTSADWVKSPR